MTAAVFNLIQTAVEHPSAGNDYAGVWHDILWMSKRGITARPDASTVLFQVKITGTGQRSIYTLKLVCGPGDEAEPVLTLMLPNED